MYISSKQANLFSRLEQAFETGIATAQQTEEYLSMVRKGFNSTGVDQVILHSPNRFIDTDKHSLGDAFGIAYAS